MSQITLATAVEIAAPHLFSAERTSSFDSVQSTKFTKMCGSKSAFYFKIVMVAVCVPSVLLFVLPLKTGKLILINYAIETLYNGYKKYLHHYPRLLMNRCFNQVLYCIKFL